MEALNAARLEPLPARYPVIDSFTETGVAVSVKSMDLAGGYSNVQTLNNVIRSNIRALENFEGARFNGARILKSEILGRELTVVIPSGGTPAQQVALDAAIQYGADRGVIVNIVTMP